MPTFNIQFSWNATAKLAIEADSREQAIQKAYDAAMPAGFDDGELTVESVIITGEEQVAPQTL